MTTNPRSFTAGRWLATLGIAGLLGFAASTQGQTQSASPALSPTPGPTDSSPRVSDAYGVEVIGARLSASDFVVDLRYRVLNADKAQPLLERKLRPVLVDEATGNRYYVPQPPVVGALRQSSRNGTVTVGKTYFMIFANPDKRLKEGDKVALFLGEQRFGNLRIER